MQNPRDFKADSKNTPSPFQGKGWGEVRLSSYQKKPHLPWERANVAAGGLYSRYAGEIAQKYPKKLSDQELRVAALSKAMLRTREIAYILCCEEETVINHRTNIRHKIGLEPGAKLCEAFLAK